jgi:septal ring-binding cell division protein DamX
MSGNPVGSGGSSFGSSGLSSGGIGNGAGVNPPNMPAISMSAAGAQPTMTPPSGSQSTTTSSGNMTGGSNYFGAVNLDKDAGQPDLLSGANMGPPPLGDDYPRAEDNDARRKRNRRVVLIGAAVAVVVIVGFWIGTRHHGDVPVITADATPEKVKPTDQGGLQVPNQNVQVLENMNGQPKSQSAETVMPPPEQPMAPPAPAAGAQAGQADQATAATLGTTAQAGTGNAATPTTGSDQSVQVPAVPTPSGTETTAAAPAAPAVPTVPAVPAVPDTNSSAMTSTAAVSAAPATTTTASAATTTKPAPTAPAATTTTQPAAKTTTAPAATPGGKVRVQLAAVKSEEAAKATWVKLQKSHPAQLGNLSLIVEKVDKGADGIFYRVQAGPLADKATAKSICSALAQQNQACLVAR